MNSKDIEKRRRETFTRILSKPNSVKANVKSASGKGGSSSSFKSGASSTTQFKTFIKVDVVSKGAHEVKKEKSNVMSEIYDYEERKKNWIPGDESIIYCQYMEAFPLFGTNWLIVKGVRLETDAEVTARAEKSPRGLNGEEIKPSPRVLISFIGLDALYKQFGVKTKSELEAMKRWFATPPFWKEALTPFIGKEMSLQDENSLVIYCYKLTEKMTEKEIVYQDATGADIETVRKTLFVMPSALLICDSLDKLSKAVIREAFPTLKNHIFERAHFKSAPASPAPAAAATPSSLKRKMFPAAASSSSQQPPASKKVKKEEEEGEEEEGEIGGNDNDHHLPPFFPDPDDILLNDGDIPPYDPDTEEF